MAVLTDAQLHQKLCAAQSDCGACIGKANANVAETAGEAFGCQNSPISSRCTPIFVEGEARTGKIGLIVRLGKHGCGLSAPGADTLTPILTQLRRRRRRPALSARRGRSQYPIATQRPLEDCPDQPGKIGDRLLRVICGRPSLASTFFALNDLFGCGHISGLQCGTYFRGP
jgi:hypothetical protein